MPTESYFATCAPGVEPLLHAELKRLRLARVERQIGGCYFEGDARAAWRVNLELRTAIRVLRRLARFDAPDEDRLYAAVRDLPWERFLAPDGTLKVDARARDSALTHTRFLEQRVKDAVVDRFRARENRRPSVDKDDPDLRIDLHLFRDRATISVDTSGDSLHRRGWRVHQGRAPLAETTVAAVLLASEWDRRAPLVDPFCGSGTIAVEAALLAGDIAPGRFGRRYGFERWLDHEPQAQAYARLAAEVRERGAVPRKLQLVASDLDPGRVDEARENVAAAGLEDHVRVEVADAARFEPRPGWNAWVLTNPPYGERVQSVGGEDPVELYRSFGRCLREGAEGYRVGVFTAHARLWKAMALKAWRRVELRNGGLECVLYLAAIGADPEDRSGGWSESEGLRPSSDAPRDRGASGRRSRRRTRRR